jgi:osmotically inducible protein OsmC
MKRTAHAQWAGDLKGGSGAIWTASGTLSQTPYSFHTRFEEGKGTNPEELLAAAHAGCFTMALSHQLSLAGLKAESLETDCTITLEQKDGAFAITESHLELKARVPGASRRPSSRGASRQVRTPVSKLFNATITLNAQLDERAYS